MSRKTPATMQTLMIKIMEVVESLHKDTMTKNCSRSGKRTEAMMEAGSDFCLINLCNINL